MFGRFWQRQRTTANGYAARFASLAAKRALPVAQPDIYDRSRVYHREAPAGKMATHPTKRLGTQDDLALAYSPGVAGPCRDIAASPGGAYDLTNKGHTVAVVSNGTAVLGLGNIGALAAKPVMEGKAALFKAFADLDAVDICLDETDPERLAEMVIALAPSFGGINLEDIRAPDCFIVEDRARAALDIPVFHDDQHGTAAVVLAALTNAVGLTDRKMTDLSIVCAGAGAAALATLDLLVARGVPQENIAVFDREGMITARRKDLHPRRAAYARPGRPVQMAEALKGADMFLGVSAGGVLDPEWIKGMAPAPIIFAMANPDPEVWPEHAREAAPDAIVATGRSDYPNQVNNVLCFPYLFRGALEARASTITDGMVIAAAEAIALLARTEPGEETRSAYPDTDFTFGPDSILPRPFDARLKDDVSAAVAAAARTDGVARA